MLTLVLRQSDLDKFDVDVVGGNWLDGRQQFRLSSSNLLTNFAAILTVSSSTSRAATVKISLTSKDANFGF